MLTLLIHTHKVTQVIKHLLSVKSGLLIHTDQETKQHRKQRERRDLEMFSGEITKECVTTARRGKGKAIIKVVSNRTELRLEPLREVEGNPVCLLTV